VARCRYRDHTLSIAVDRVRSGRRGSDAVNRASARRREHVPGSRPGRRRGSSRMRARVRAAREVRHRGGLGPRRVMSPIRSRPGARGSRAARAKVTCRSPGRTPAWPHR